MALDKTHLGYTVLQNAPLMPHPLADEAGGEGSGKRDSENFMDRYRSFTNPTVFVEIQGFNAKIGPPMTEIEIAAFLADAIQKEHAARQVGAAALQAIAMDEIRRLRALAAAMVKRDQASRIS